MLNVLDFEQKDQWVVVCRAMVAEDHQLYCLDAGGDPL